MEIDLNSHLTGQKQRYYSILQRDFKIPARKRNGENYTEYLSIFQDLVPLDNYKVFIYFGDGLIQVVDLNQNGKIIYDALHPDQQHITKQDDIIKSPFGFDDYTVNLQQQRQLFLEPINHIDTAFLFMQCFDDEPIVVYMVKVNEPFKKITLTDKYRGNIYSCFGWKDNYAAIISNSGDSQPEDKVSYPTIKIFDIDKIKKLESGDYEVKEENIILNFGHKSLEEGWCLSDIHFADYNNSKIIWTRLGDNHPSLDVYNPHMNKIVHSQLDHENTDCNFSLSGNYFISHISKDDQEDEDEDQQQSDEYLMISLNSIINYAPIILDVLKKKQVYQNFGEDFTSQTSENSIYQKSLQNNTSVLKNENLNNQSQQENNLKQSPIDVYVRIRPPNQKELIEGNNKAVQKVSENNLIVQNSNNVYQFQYDKIFDASNTQEDVMNQACIPVLQHVLNGYNGCFMAYGQTGTGKTYTMGLIDKIQNPNQGMVSMAFKYLFDYLNQASNENQLEWSLSMSFLQIYNEDIYDLLNPDGKKLKIKEDSDLKEVFVKDLVTVPIRNQEQAYQLINAGLTYRSMGAQNMNQLSSRSHTVLNIYLTQKLNLDDYLLSTMSFLDLAGSERVKKSQSSGQRLQEAKHINTSLCSLSNVISALSENKPGQHIPYRNSKLTRILQNSLNSKSKIVLIGTLNANEAHAQESISTMRFASQCKKIEYFQQNNFEGLNILKSDSNQIQQENKILKNELQNNQKKIQEQDEIIKKLQYQLSQSGSKQSNFNINNDYTSVESTQNTNPLNEVFMGENLEKSQNIILDELQKISQQNEEFKITNFCQEDSKELLDYAENLKCNSKLTVQVNLNSIEIFKEVVISDNDLPNTIIDCIQEIAKLTIQNIANIQSTQEQHEQLKIEISRLVSKQDEIQKEKFQNMWAQNMNFMMNVQKQIIQEYENDEKKTESIFNQKKPYILQKLQDIIRSTDNDQLIIPYFRKLSELQQNQAKDHNNTNMSINKIKDGKLQSLNESKACPNSSILYQQANNVLSLFNSTNSLSKLNLQQSLHKYFIPESEKKQNVIFNQSFMNKITEPQKESKQNQNQTENALQNEKNALQEQNETKQQILQQQQSVYNNSLIDNMQIAPNFSSIQRQNNQNNKINDKNENDVSHSNLIEFTPGLESKYNENQNINNNSNNNHYQQQHQLQSQQNKGSNENQVTNLQNQNQKKIQPQNQDSMFVESLDVLYQLAQAKKNGDKSFVKKLIEKNGLNTQFLQNNTINDSQTLESLFNNNINNLSKNSDFQVNEFNPNNNNNNNTNFSHLLSQNYNSPSLQNSQNASQGQKFQQYSPFMFNDY
ncbi:P-loop containing nucleoside triphosphate hydrolase [Pseudocohnilembus persalinus]|uniref:p-loop containing nucleoside triphosphate hydrolase n=1 Tax=Pseudocohnilembus persalinus TaxID=266149 RepID=A0A0V0R7R2_PSEPJ|nr:P-loop containing nucleoside triphosphate hydrolase [Pseudocohnilembus persalinus]|eukprot:KRX10521.1 P-loop containing nucleoside triphosphate hydrolase [Pseudocohnilembus persalinus]